MGTRASGESKKLFFRQFPVEPRKGDLQKQRIVDAVIDRIATEGIERTSFDSVGKLLGMRPSHVAYYFESKEEMIEFAIRHIAVTGQTITAERVDEAGDPRKRIMAVVDGAFDWCARFPKQAAAMLLFYYYASFDSHYRKMHTEMRSVGAKRLEGLLDGLRPNLRNKKALASTIQALITGNALEYLTTGLPDGIEAYRKRTIEAVMSLL